MRLSKRKHEMTRPQVAVVPPERTGGEQSEPTGPGGGTTDAARAEPEVSEKAKRRTFTAEYKPMVLYVVGQSFNLILTLAVAWLAFVLLFPNAV
jgi:hypothetical protein